MKEESKKRLHKGRIYRKDGVWVVQYKTIERVRGGSPKQLGNYKLQPKINYVPIRLEDTARLNDPYDQGKETCFELILANEPRNEFQEVRFIADTEPVWYAKLWPTSKMVQDLQHYLDTTPQEKIDEDWKKVEELDLVGPTVEEFLNQNNMSESINMQRMYLERSLHNITQQEVPVLSTNPAYMLFVQRKIAASKYLNEMLSEVGKEELLHYIEHCNEQIKKVLAL
jgi:hypothetical protein